MEPGTRTFEIAHCLGRGGFGEVYRATMRTQGGLESDVALKVLRRDLDPAGQSVQRLRDEGRLLARLDHPVILRVHDLALLEGRVALITEYIAGEDVETLMKDRVDPIGPRALVEVIAKVAHALDAAWNAPLRDGTPLNLVHRDIKPSNIRVGKHGEVKLLDFGIARTDAVIREARTQTDMMVGSPAYMAPERFRENSLDPQSDVFALGATLLEGITHRRFYGRMELPRIAGLALDAQSFADHTQAQLDRLPADIHPQLLQLLRDTLTHDTGARITSAQLADRAELLTEALPGPQLARWCRARTFRAENTEAAEMSGRTVSEGQLPNAAASLEREAPPPTPPPTLDETSMVSIDAWDPEPQPASGPSGWLLATVGVVAMGAAGLAGLTIAGLSGLAVSQYGAQPSGDEDVEAPAPTPEVPIEAPEDPPGGVPDELPAPEPAAPSPQPRPRPAPVEAPAPTPPPTPTPTPTPAPVAPAPAPRGPATVSTEGGVDVRALGPGGAVALPGSLPAGAYSFQASFVAGAPVDIGTRQIGGDEHWNVTCSRRMTRCEITKQ